MVFGSDFASKASVATTASGGTSSARRELASASGASAAAMNGRRRATGALYTRGGSLVDPGLRGTVGSRAPRRSPDDPPVHGPDPERPQGLDRARGARRTLRGALGAPRQERAAHSRVPEA